MPVCRFPWAGLFFLAFCLAAPAAFPQEAAQDVVAPIITALRGHDFSQARELSRSALAAHPGDYRIWTLCGMAAAGTHDLSGALSSYQRALQLQPTYLPALEGAAQTKFQLGQDARPILEKILVQRPEDPVSHLLLGIFDFRNHDCAKALDHFNHAAPVITRQPEALTDEGTCLAASGQAGDAVTAFTQVLAIDPASPAARYNLALAQHNAHDLEAALTTLRPLTDASPPHPDALTLAAEIAESAGDTAQAVTLLRSAILAKPKDIEAYLQFATLSFDHASPQVGVDIVSAGIGQMPREPRLFLVRGVLLAQMGEFTRAADDFDRANQLDPSLQFLGVAQGLVQSQEHNSQQALAHFRAAVKAHPNEAYGWYLLAEALAGEGKPSAGSDYAEEIRAATTAVKLDPKLVEAHDLLSSAYYSAGRMQDSIDQSRAALAINASDEAALYHLMLALRKTGQDDEARGLVKQLMELRAHSRVNQPPARYYHLYEQKEPGIALSSPGGPH